ncbi:MAG: phage holin [Clostridium sp.]|nr:phage holin [Clostridium sp.]
MKIDKPTIIRTVILFISIVNAVLNMFDIKTLPIDNDMVSEAVSVGILLFSTISSWWHNNSFTEKARLADEYLKNLKEEK